MSGKSKPVMLIFTAATRDEAENLGEALVGQGLARRGSVIPLVHSFWMAGGKLERSHEAMLFLTTSTDKAEAATDYVRGNYSFAEPLIVTLPIGE